MYFTTYIMCILYVYVCIYICMYTCIIQIYMCYVVHICVLFAGIYNTYIYDHICPFQAQPYVSVHRDHLYIDPPWQELSLGQLEQRRLWWYHWWMNKEGFLK